MRKFLKIKGFLTIEIVVAISLIVVSILVSMSVAHKSIYLSRQALHNAQASFLLEEGTEIIRISRDNSWSNISNLTNSTAYYPVFSGSSWSLSTTPLSVGIFTRTITLSAVNRDANSDIAVSGTNDSGTRLVTVAVSWNEGGTTISKTLLFYIMDIFS